MQDNFEESDHSSLPPRQPDPFPIPSSKKIATALALAQAKMVQPEKNKTVTVKTRDGRTYTFDYADYGAIVKAVVGPLSENGICFTHLTQYLDRQLILVTKLIHGESGEELETIYPLPSTSDPKDFGGALTYGKRYSLSAITGCVADDDADADPQNTTDLQDRQPRQPSATPAPAPRPAGPSPVQPKTGPAPVATGPSAAQMTRLWTIAGASKWSNEQVHLFMNARWGIESAKALNRGQYDELCELMPAKSYEQACVAMVGKSGP